MCEEIGNLSIFTHDIKGAVETTRRRHLTGSRVHRLSRPEKLELDVEMTTQRHDKKQSSGGDGGIPTERTNKIQSSGAQVTLSPSRIFFMRYLYLRLPIGLFTQA